MLMGFFIVVNSLWVMVDKSDINVNFTKSSIKSLTLKLFYCYSQ